MIFPREFPDQSRIRVELEETLASQEFDRLRKDLPWSSYGPGPELEKLVREYVLRIWSTFVEEACELGRQRIWDLGRVKTESLEFLSQLTSKAYLEKGFDFGGRAYPGQLRRLPEMTSHGTGEILPEVMSQYQTSAEWQRYQELLLGVGEAWAAEPEQKVLAASKPTEDTQFAKPAPFAQRSWSSDVTYDPNLRAERRRAVVEPILNEKRWSRSKLAAQAGIGKNSVYEYLTGKRTLSAENRRALAEELGLKPEELPE